MKLQFHPIIEKLSGKLKDLVFVTKKVPMKGDPSHLNHSTYIRSKPVRTAPTTLRQDHLNLAFKIVSESYQILKASPDSFVTWREAAKELSQRDNKTLSSYHLFQSYFMTLYTHTLGIDVKPEYLSPGLSLSYAHRDTRSWNSITPQGYGTRTYGAGSYGR